MAVEEELERCAGLAGGGHSPPAGSARRPSYDPEDTPAYAYAVTGAELAEIADELEQAVEGEELYAGSAYTEDEHGQVVLAAGEELNDPTPQIELDYDGGDDPRTFIYDNDVADDAYGTADSGPAALSAAALLDGYDSEAPPRYGTGYQFEAQSVTSQRLDAVRALEDATLLSVEVLSCAGRPSRRPRRDDPDPELQRIIERALWEIRQSAYPPTWPALAVALRWSESTVRRYAARHAERIGRPVAPARRLAPVRRRARASRP
jgi:hypothetical protein